MVSGLCLISCVCLPSDRPCCRLDAPASLVHERVHGLGKYSGVQSKSEAYPGGRTVSIPSCGPPVAFLMTVRFPEAALLIPWSPRWTVGQGDGNKGAEEAKRRAE